VSKKIYLSPSVQEKNIGFGDYGSEALRMNEVADVVERVLTDHGLIIKRNSIEMSLTQIVRDSIHFQPNIHLSIHSNASKNGTARGAEVFCHQFGGEGERLARLIYKELEAISPVKGRGVKEGKNFYGENRHMYELANTKAPAALVEVAFHDNKEDAEWIINNIEEIGIALTKGVFNFFNIEYSKLENASLAQAVDVLAKEGILKSPEYWLQNARKGSLVKGEYAAILIERAANYILEQNSNGDHGE
jgi:N-acetylmuramoyl-L-alanine amidase